VARSSGSAGTQDFDKTVLTLASGALAISLVLCHFITG
jgi:hypothetical protein